MGGALGLLFLPFPLGIICKFLVQIMQFTSDKDSFLLHAYYVHGVGEIAVLLFGKKLYTWHA